VEEFLKSIYIKIFLNQVKYDKLCHFKLASKSIKHFMKHTTKIILSSVLTASVFAFFGVGIAYAQYLGFDSGKNTGLPQQDVRVITMYIIKNILSVLGIIFLVITIYAGFIWMTAGGNDEKVAEGKKWLTRSVIGLAIILSAYSITIFVTNALIKASMPQGGVNTSVWDLF
jgi:TRAP-type C4-dicarboxylate transport system permease small subunit